jgi:hypothetical protein
MKLQRLVMWQDRQQLGCEQQRKERERGRQGSLQQRGGRGGKDHAQDREEGEGVEQAEGGMEVGWSGVEAVGGNFENDSGDEKEKMESRIHSS